MNLHEEKNHSKVDKKMTSDSKGWITTTIATPTAYSHGYTNIGTVLEAYLFVCVCAVFGVVSLYIQNDNDQINK